MEVCSRSLSSTPPTSVSPNTLFTMSGQRSLGDRPLLYTWTQDAGPAITIPNNGTQLAPTPMIRSPPGPGLEQVRLAKEDGRWAAAYDSPKTVTAPDDLLAALERSAPAKEFFGKLDASNRYAIYFRVTTAKRPETQRIAQFVKDLAQGAVPYPDRLPKELRRSAGDRPTQPVRGSTRRTRS